MQNMVSVFSQECDGISNRVHRAVALPCANNSSVLATLSFSHVRKDTVIGRS